MNHLTKHYHSQDGTAQMGQIVNKAGRESNCSVCSGNINEVIRAVSNFLLFFSIIRFRKYKKTQNVVETIEFFNWCR